MMYRMYFKRCLVLFWALFAVLFLALVQPVWAKTVTLAQSSAAVVASSSPQITALFSPQDNIEQAIVAAIGRANKQILVQAYLLTDNKISDALIAAHKRGVAVQVMLDAERSKTKASDVQRMSDAGIEVRLETAYENAHNKVMILDGALLISGSYNFTYAAQFKNAENIMLIKNAPQLIAQYTQNWRNHFAVAVPFK
jgi:phosphatidylserine/phosphatidylglycerophosphate/cardiolipin synthase-like enzyme